MSMTKADIVEQVFKEVEISKKDAQDIVENVFSVIKDSLAKGEKVKISGFGNFSIRDKSSRRGRNPQTGTDMEISARRVLSFKPSQVLKEDIQSKFEHRLSSDGTENEELAPNPGTDKALNSFRTNTKE
jgi:integration host factor subunit alpha